jgi:hypothetical protein
LKKIEEKITIPDTHLKIQLKPKGFFHNHNKGVNGLLGYKAQIFLYRKEKIGILTAILPEEIRFSAPGVAYVRPHIKY